MNKEKECIIREIEKRAETDTFISFDEFIKKHHLKD
jgi:hypothetical protein